MQLNKRWQKAMQKVMDAEMGEEYISALEAQGVIEDTMTKDELYFNEYHFSKSLAVV